MSFAAFTHYSCVHVSITPANFLPTLLGAFVPKGVRWVRLESEKQARPEKTNSKPKRFEFERKNKRAQCSFAGRRKRNGRACSDVSNLPQTVRGGGVFAPKVHHQRRHSFAPASSFFPSIVAASSNITGMISFFVDASVSLDSIGFAFSTRVRDSLLSIIFFTCKILIQWNTSKQNSSITSTTITTAGSS